MSRQRESDLVKVARERLNVRVPLWDYVLPIVGQVDGFWRIVDQPFPKEQREALRNSPLRTRFDAWKGLTLKAAGLYVALITPFVAASMYVQS